MILIILIFIITENPDNTVDLKKHMSSSTIVYAMNCWYLSYSKSINLIFETSFKKSTNMEYEDLAHFMISSSHKNKF